MSESTDSPFTQEEELARDDMRPEEFVIRIPRDWCDRLIARVWAVQEHLLAHAPHAATLEQESLLDEVLKDLYLLQRRTTQTDQIGENDSAFYVDPLSEDISALSGSFSFTVAQLSLFIGFANRVSQVARSGNIGTLVDGACADLWERHAKLFERFYGEPLATPRPV